MAIIPGLDDVRTYWLEVRLPGTVLHGYLLYATSDHRFPEYMADEGIEDLDVWTGDECGIFVFQTPPGGWAKHAVRTNHIWAQLVKKVYGERAVDEILKSLSNALQYPEGNRFITELFTACADAYLHRDLINQILAQFELPPSSHPCILFFEDLYGRKFWHLKLDDLLNKPEGDLRKALKLWFEGPEFTKLMKACRRANTH